MKLYSYQEEDVNTMQGKPFFLLANEMGTGKTIEVLTEIQREYLPGDKWPKVLVICPNSVKSVWEDHIEQMFPWVPVMTLSGSTREGFNGFKYGFVIVNSEALRLIPEFRKLHWDYIIADECHMFKNRKAQRTRALKKIKGNHRRGLSGTPMVNRPDELWSILHWLSPKDYGSYWRFFEKYVAWVDSGYGYRIVTGPRDSAGLNAELQPFMLRRRKADVLKDLPDKYYTYMRIDMSREQSKAYLEMKKDSIAWLESLDGDQPLPAPTVLAQLTRLRQFATAYCELKGYDDIPGSFGEIPGQTYLDHKGYVQMTEPSNKIDALMEIIEDTNEPIVVFSQFKQAIKLAMRRLESKGIPYLGMTGDTPQSDRGDMIYRFQHGEVPVFLATIQTGGVGITLHRASTAVFLDRSWSPAYNLQAEDRLHRIGQDQAVQIIVLQSKGTVDLTVERKLERKASWLRQIIDGEH